MIETMPGDDDWVDTESDTESQNSELPEFEHTKRCKNINRWVLPVENDTYNWRKIKLLTNLEYFDEITKSVTPIDSHKLNELIQ